MVQKSKIRSLILNDEAMSNVFLYKKNNINLQLILTINFTLKHTNTF